MPALTSWRRILAAVLTGLLALGVTVVITDNGADHGPDKPRRIITIKVGPSSTAPPAGDLQTKDVEQLRDETPAAVPPAVLKHAEQVEEKTAAPLPAVTSPLPVGGAQGYSCRTDYATHGYGNRRSGAKVMSFKLHYTVSANIPGWGDVTGVGDYLERVGLSAHLIADFEGHCLKKVPFERNAFTQGAFNSTSESVEIIATGRETRAQWLAAPLIKKGILAAIVRDRLRARGLPLRFVDPVGCADRLGYTDHNHLECGNNHVDVSPNFPFDVFARQLRDGPGVVTVTDRVTCRKLNAWRQAGRPKGGRWEANSVRRRRALTKRHVACGVKGPVRR